MRKWLAWPGVGMGSAGLPLRTVVSGRDSRRTSLYPKLSLFPNSVLSSPLLSQSLQSCRGPLRHPLQVEESETSPHSWSMGT